MRFTGAGASIGNSLLASWTGTTSPCSSTRTYPAWPRMVSMSCCCVKVTVLPLCKHRNVAIVFSQKRGPKPSCYYTARAMTKTTVEAAILTEAAVGLYVTIVTPSVPETCARLMSPTSLTPCEKPRTMSPKRTPGTATVSVAVAPAATDAGSRVQTTSQVSENKPRNWSLPRREVIAVAAGMI